MLRYLTAGESHGHSLSLIIDGLPSGLTVSIDDINHQLWRRRQGYGRGQRMKIEDDKVEVLSGMRFGETLGTPLSMLIQNKDWRNWSDKMAVSSPRPPSAVPIHRPRPGHADLAGSLKYGHNDIRNVLERASARSTATLTAIGSVARQLLEIFNIHIYSYVVEIGGVSTYPKGELKDIVIEADASIVRMPGDNYEVLKAIDRAKAEGDTVGGIFEVVATGVPIGLGSYAMPDSRLDGLFAQALMSIPAIKGVEIGQAFKQSGQRGSTVHDEIYYEHGIYSRGSNNAGGIEGGVSNGEPIVLRAAMKPLSTLYNPLKSINMVTKEVQTATVERSDICAVPAASVVGEAVVAWVICKVFLDKFGGDSMQEIRSNYDNYIKSTR